MSELNEADDRSPQPDGATNALPVDSDTLTTLHDGERTIWLVGTAHVSPESVREVREIIDAVRPDVVAVELCKPRFEALTDESRWKNLNIFDVIRSGRVLFLLANIALGAYQRRIGARLGVKPGAELLEAVHAAADVGARVELIDREIHATLRRAWASVGFWKKSMLMASLTEGMFGGGGKDVEAEDIEALKEKGRLNDVMSEFATALPEVKGALIDERDSFMISKLANIPDRRIVAVVGAGHVPGMVGLFPNGGGDTEVLSEMPPPSMWGTALKWALPAAVLLSFYWGYRETAGRSLEYMIWAWTIPNAVMAAICTIIAGGRPLTVLTAAVASPITSLNPLVAAGFVAGLVEAWLRKPTVADAERINDDVQSIRGLYRNAFTRVLLVVFLANLGSALGAWIGAAFVFTAVTGEPAPTP